MTSLHRTAGWVCPPGTRPAKGGTPAQRYGAGLCRTGKERQLSKVMLSPSRFKRGDVLIVDGVEVRVTRLGIRDGGEYIVPTSHGAQRFNALTTYEVERGNAVIHADGGSTKNRSACHARGDAVVTSKHGDVTCTERQCQNAKKAWEKERLLAATVGGTGKVNSYWVPQQQKPEDYEASWSLAAEGTVLVTSPKLGEFTGHFNPERSFTKTDLELALAAVEDAMSNARAVVYARKKHPDVVPDVPATEQEATEQG